MLDATGTPVVLAMAIASLIVLGLSLILLLLRRGKAVPSAITKSATAATVVVEDDPSMPRVRILYGTQTGTAGKTMLLMLGC